MSKNRRRPHRQRKGESRDIPEIWRGTAPATEVANPEEISLTARSLTIGEVLDQFRSMRDNAASFLHEPPEPDTDAIWSADMEAIDAATAILMVLQAEGIQDAEQTKDLIFDYTLANRQLQEMHRKYQTPTAAEREGETLLCPECHARLGFFGRHCGNCGKRIAGR